MLVAYAPAGKRLGFPLGVGSNAAYVTRGDEVSLLPDGYLASVEPAKIWYVNNDCTGAAYLDGSSVRARKQAVTGHLSRLYTLEPATSLTSSFARGSFSVGSTCTPNMPGAANGYLLAATNRTWDLLGTMPWDIVLE